MPRHLHPALVTILPAAAALLLALPLAAQQQNSGSAQQPSSTQQTTTQQIIAETVKHLIEQLEQGKSEALTAYLGSMARFHNYSFGNILSIAHHRPDATCLFSTFSSAKQRKTTA